MTQSQLLEGVVKICIRGDVEATAFWVTSTALVTVEHAFTHLHGGEAYARWENGTLFFSDQPADDDEKVTIHLAQGGMDIAVVVFSTPQAVEALTLSTIKQWDSSEATVLKTYGYDKHSFEQYSTSIQASVFRGASDAQGLIRGQWDIQDYSLREGWSGSPIVVYKNTNAYVIAIVYRGGANATKSIAISVREFCDWLKTIVPQASVVEALERPLTAPYIVRDSLDPIPSGQQLDGKKYYYLDLFDDDLYQSPILSGQDDPRLVDQLNTIRYQVLLAILFEKIIVVPEQWAISSATFLKVAGEVLHGYEGCSALLEPGSYGVSQKKVPPPFAITFIDRQIDRNVAFLAAFNYRLENNRRIRIARTLDTTAQHGENSRRNKLLRYFSQIINNDGGKIIRQDQFIAELAQHIDDYECAKNLNQLYQYVSNTPAALYKYPNERYRQAMAANVMDVERVFLSDYFNSDTSDEVLEFKEFWRRVNERAVPKDQIMEMQTLVEGFHGSSMALIKRMGRFVMHNALAEATNVDYISSLGSAFDPLNQHFLHKAYDEKIIEQIRKQKKIRANTQQKFYEDADLGIWALQASEFTPIKGSINWSAIWQSVWSFSISSEWKVVRSKISKVIADIPYERRHEHEIWEEVFSAINTAVTLFHIQFCKQNATHFIISIPVTERIISPNILTEQEIQKALNRSVNFTKFRGPIAMLMRMVGLHQQDSEPGENFNDQSLKGLDYEV